MADDRIIRSIVEKCKFFYDDALLSDETIIEKYLSFFARQFDPAERSVSFAFHTGSLCFDVVSVAALMIGCLAYEFSTNDEILAELDIDSMVLYKGERYRWGGIKKLSGSRGEAPKDYIVLNQDAKGRNGASSTAILYHRNKHLVKPYYGTSALTDGRGIKKDNPDRIDFIAHVLDIAPADVPTTIDLSAVVVSDKNEFLDICKHLAIQYNGEKTVNLTDIVPISYYSSTGEQLQIGKNPSKAEAVIKVTCNMSMARDLILDRSGNRVIGLLVVNTDALTADTVELNDLLRRKSLKFAYVTAPFNAVSCDRAMEQYESAKMFACTKELLSASRHEVKSANKLTNALNRQISNILNRETHTIKVDSYWTWEQYKDIKDKLYAIKQSAWSGEERDNFILSAMALLNLFTSSFFSMKQMESAIAAGEINVAVVSPEIRLSEMMEIASNAYSMRTQCVEIVSELLDVYASLTEYCPKEAALYRFLQEHSDKRIALVVPKAYYAELFAKMFLPEFDSVSCITANRFDKQNEFDIIITPGDVIGKRFDALQCYSAPMINVLLYEYEEKLFSRRRRNSVKSERKLNARIKGLKIEDYNDAISDGKEDSEDVISDTTLREFSELDDYVESMGMFDIRKLTANSGTGSDSGNTAEVQYVGIFTTGEQILFSKYYSAVVFDQNKGTVSETNPEKLLPGDVLVFTKRNDYTRNIVDQIFDQLIRTRKLNADVMDAAEKAFYWKAALREYKDKHKLTYKAVARELKKFGSSLQDVSIRQWLIEERHIVGPKDVKTMQIVAKVTQDPYLLNDPSAYFEACRVVRRYRREILSLIAQAINDKLSNKQPVPGSAFEIVYENVKALSETLELEKVIELDDVAFISNNIVNRPISEAEVLM